MLRLQLALFLREGCEEEEDFFLEGAREPVAAAAPEEREVDALDVEGAMAGVQSANTMMCGGGGGGGEAAKVGLSGNRARQNFGELDFPACPTADRNGGWPLPCCRLFVQKPRTCQGIVARTS